MPVPNTFANATSAIPLSQLDNNFATAITIGNTAVQLGNTVTTLNNMTMANVTISSVSTPITVAQGGTGLTTATAANNAIYSTAAGTLTAGTLPVAAGGTGATTLTSNNVLIGNGTGAVSFVAPGTSGNVLTSNGTVWASTAPAGGSSGWVYLSTVTASSSATVDIETTFNSTYDTYVIVANALLPANNNTFISARLKINGTYQSASYAYIANNNYSQNAANGFTGSSSDSAIYLNPSERVSNSSSAVSNFMFFVNNPASTSTYKYVYWKGVAPNNNDATWTGYLDGAASYWGGTQALTGVRFLMSAGNIASGTFRLYGIKTS